MVKLKNAFDINQVFRFLIKRMRRPCDLKQKHELMHELNLERLKTLNLIILDGSQNFDTNTEILCKAKQKELTKI